MADLSEPMGAARLYAAALRVLGGLPPDALVNNAALYAGDEAALRAVNLEAPAALTRLMAGRESGRGSVVNILDAAILPDAEGVVPSDAPGRAAYLAAKRALQLDTLRSAALFADTLRVNAVAPGPVLAPEGAHEIAGETPLGRPTPEAVADAVAFLLDAVSTTGCTIPVDGGRRLFPAAAGEDDVV